MAFFLLVLKSGGRLDLAKDSEKGILTVRQPSFHAKRKKVQVITEPTFPPEDEFVDRFANVEIQRFKTFVENQSSYIFYEEEAGNSWVSCFATGAFNKFVTPTVSPNSLLCPKMLREAANVLQIYLYYNYIIDPETTDRDFRNKMLDDGEVGWCATTAQAEILMMAIDRYNGVSFKTKLLRFVEDFKMFFMVRKNLRVEVYRTKEEEQRSTRKKYDTFAVAITCTVTKPIVLPIETLARKKKKQTTAKTKVGSSTTGRRSCH